MTSISKEVVVEEVEEEEEADTKVVKVRSKGIMAVKKMGKKG
jgi:hypothetical protein